jgi:peptide deformylase
MTVKQIVTYPNDKLQEAAVDSILSDQLQSHVKDLLDTIKHYEGCQFITSNQINSNERVAIFDLNQLYQKAVDNNSRYLIVVNPKILSRSKSVITFKETSISTPFFKTTSNKSEQIEVSFAKVKINYEEQKIEASTETAEAKVISQPKIESLSFEELTETYNNETGHLALAVTMQSVVDQLDGKCYLDNLSWYARQQYVKSRKKVINKFKKMISQQMRM